MLFSLVELSPVSPVSLIERLGQGSQENQHSRSLYIHGSNVPHKYGQNASLYPSFEESWCRQLEPHGHGANDKT